MFLNWDGSGSERREWIDGKKCAAIKPYLVPSRCDTVF